VELTIGDDVFVCVAAENNIPLSGGGAQVGEVAGVGFYAMQPLYLSEP